MVRVTWLAVLLLIGAHHPVAAQERPPTDAEIRKLIEQLASPNKAPIAYPDDGARSSGAQYPPGYDDDAQKKVRAAYYRLQKLGVAAFPVLLPQMNDGRYSFTLAPDEVDYNWTVGLACRDLVQTQVQAYCNIFRHVPGEGDWKLRPRRPSYLEGVGAFPPHRHASEPWDVKKAQAWWEARKHKSLRELQIEALEWTIAEEAKRPQDFSDAERAHLQKMLADLKASDQPRRPYPLEIP